MRHRRSIVVDVGVLSQWVSGIVASRNEQIRRQILSFDKRGEGWELVKNTPRSVDLVANLSIGLSSLMPEYATQPLGIDKVLQRAKELRSNLGQADLEFLLKHSEMIKFNIEPKSRVFFPGTVWREENKNKLFLPYLYIEDGTWKMGFGSAAFHFASHCPNSYLVCFRERNL
ncbi:MAG: hypothetical protein M1312_01035 [Patescibacteria group bacterium]|nr:hypothetical protein [Patescibacteria group bacterium]